MRKYKRWSDEEISALKEFVKTGKQFKYSCEVLPNRSLKNIIKYASDHGIKSEYTFGARKYSCDKNFWDIPNETNSYWAGFSLADASVVNRLGSFSFSLELGGIDKSHLEKFKLQTSSTYQVKERQVSFNGKKFSSAFIKINCRNWEKPLSENFGIIPRKTFNYQPFNFAENLLDYFIAGFIDGDGSYVASIDKERDRERFYISAIAHEKEFLDVICDFSKRFGGQREVSKRGDNFSFSISGIPAIKMAHHLMSLPCDHLQRKYNVVKQFLDRHPEYELFLK